MARLSYVVLIIAMNVLMCVLAQEKTYDPKYDKFDVEALFNNDILREDYLKCHLETAPCKTEEMKIMTDLFDDALQTECKKCTEKQKEMVGLVKAWYIKNLPEKWQQILAKSAENMKKKNANQ